MNQKQKYRYVANDPDVRNSAYAIVDEEGKLVDSWVVKAKNIENSAKIHATEPLRKIEKDCIYIGAVESQQFYKGDDARLVKSLLQLARACGISMSYLSRVLPLKGEPQLILPREWTKGRPKTINQFWILNNLGCKSIIKTNTYCWSQDLVVKHKQSEQKHIVDAIGIAQYIREQHQKQMELAEFKASKK